MDITYLNELYRESALKELENGPYLITGMCLQILRRLFRDTTQLQFDCNKDYVYSDDPKLCKIDIIPDYQWDRQTCPTPKIVVRRNAIGRTKLGIGDKIQGHVEDFAPKSVFMAQLAGSMDILCLSKNPMTTEFLATEVAMFLYGFSPILREEFRLAQLEMKQIGKSSRLKADRTQWVVPVTIEYAYLQKWSLAPATGLLKGVIVEAEFTD